MKPKRTIYYTDPLRDDFAGNHIKTREVKADFPFVNKGKLWNFSAFLLYNFLALPIAYLVSKIYLGIRFENKKALKEVKESGVFLYGNHTRELDPFIPALAVFPKKAYVVANPDAVSIPFLKSVVLMLGAIPIPTELGGMRGFWATIRLRYSQGSCIAIYPEAHIWPFYTGIRPFADTSFRYPVEADAPVVAMVTTYRKRRGLFRFCKKPGMTVTFSEPMYPDASLPARKAKAELRDRVYSFMCRVSSAKENVQYIEYVKKQ